MINQPPLSKLVARELRERIWSGVLAPGQRLIEVNIASEFAISRGSLREAMQMLEREGLVESVPRHGTFVRDLTVEDLREISEVRLMLETFAFLRAARVTTSADLVALRQIVVDMEEAGERGDWEKLQSADLQFHRSVVALSANRRVIEYYSAIQGQIRLLFTHLPIEYPDLQQLIAEHRELLAALKQRDEAAVLEAITAHLKDAEEKYLRHTRVRTTQA